jgi:hypothetical protein
LLSSAAGFWRVKRWETSVRASHQGPVTAEDIERDIAVRRNLAMAFGIEVAPTTVLEREISEDARVERNLRAAHLI